MRTFKTKWLARFARREGITDESLREAIERAEHGLIDADLGGGLIKQRVARKGQGRASGYRMIVAYHTKERAVFLYAFAKNEQENIGSDELTELRKLGLNWINSPPQKIAQAIEDGALQEVDLEEQKESSRLSKAILEMAADQHRIGIMDDAAYRKITIRHLGPQALSTADPISAEEIRALREREHLSQAVFARYLNLTVGYVSQLERGTKQPRGPALTLLNVIRRKGLEAIL